MNGGKQGARSRRHKLLRLAKGGPGQTTVQYTLYLAYEAWLGSGMRVEMLDLLRVLANSRVAEDVFASELAEEAAQAERIGDAGTAAILRDLSRRHRIKALASDGQFVALQQQYALLYGDTYNV